MPARLALRTREAIVLPFSHEAGKGRTLAHFSGKGGGNDWVGVSSCSASHKESMRNENRVSYQGSLSESSTLKILSCLHSKGVYG